MDCANCELPRVKFYCDNCLKSQYVLLASPRRTELMSLIGSITKFKALLSSVSSVRDAHIADAKKALETINPAREQRATKAKLQEKIRDVQAELKRIKDANSKSKFAVDRRRRLYLDDPQHKPGSPSFAHHTELVATIFPVQGD
jgi:hypothetical protein